MLDQHECGAGRALCCNISVTRLVHVIKSIRDARRHALLETLRRTAKLHRPQLRLCCPEDIELGPHGVVDQIMQIAGDRCVTLEAEVHIAGHIAVPRDPDFAVAEAAQLT